MWVLITLGLGAVGCTVGSNTAAWWSMRRRVGAASLLLLLVAVATPFVLAETQRAAAEPLLRWEPTWLSPGWVWPVALLLWVLLCTAALVWAALVVVARPYEPEPEPDLGTPFVLPAAPEQPAQASHWTRPAPTPGPARRDYEREVEQMPFFVREKRKYHP